MEVVKFAQEKHLDLAVKCGGHSTGGTSSSDGGIVIDLSKMRNVTVDANNKVITAQGGALWSDVDDAAGKHGLATVGGTVNHTGIGGLTLGGGYGWLSPKYGLTVDNLISATVVLANGEIVTASLSEREDLFWALRGAGHNFGVVTEFKFRAYDQKNDVFAGLLSFSPEKLEAVITFLNSTIEHPNENAGALCALAKPPGAPFLVVNVVVQYNGTEEEAKKHYSGLFELGPLVDDTKMIPYPQLNGLLNGLARHGGRRTFKGIFFDIPLRPSFVRGIFDSFAQIVQTDPEFENSAIMLEYLDYRKTDDVSIESTAFSNRGRTLNGVLSFVWNDPSRDSQYRQYSRELQAVWKQEFDQQLAQSNTKLDAVPLYVNYAEREYYELITIMIHVHFPFELTVLSSWRFGRP